MSERKKEKIGLPDYWLSEELISAISHGVGAALAIAALVLCVVRAAGHGGFQVVSSCIYGSSMILAYLASCIYHSLARNRGKKVFRVFDHCSIFLLIAGSYTPFTLGPLRGPVGWTLFGVVWGLAVLGIVFDSIDLERFSKPALVVYLLMGWCIVLVFPMLLKRVPWNCIVLLLAGGVAFTLGAILYGIGSKVRYVHSVWHFFVLAGSILQFFAIYWYVI